MSKTLEEMNIFERSLARQTHPELFEIKPKFKVGDVVYTLNETRNAYDHYFIKEAIFVDTDSVIELPKYVYEVGDIHNPDKSIIFDESALNYYCHDINWDEYVRESVGNGLPRWRGELYNYYVASSNGDDVYYNDDTIPPDYMYHILNDHSVAKRFGDIIQDKKCYDEIQQTLKLSNKRKVEEFRDDLIKKLIAYDKLDTDIHHPGRLVKQSNGKFTNEEEAFIKIIDKYDPKDLYPFRMTSLQIMHAIKEAYANAYKVERTKSLIGEDRRTGKHYAPNKGQRKYRGESKTYNMIIEFWFDLDMKIITTAYPVEFHGIKSKKKNKE